MAKIEKIAQAGTLESSDIMITVAPEAAGVHIELQSIVLPQYGDAIRATLEKTIAGQGIDVRKSDLIRVGLILALSIPQTKLKSVLAKLPPVK